METRLNELGPYSEQLFLQYSSVFLYKGKSCSSPCRRKVLFFFFFVKIVC